MKLSTLSLVCIASLALVACSSDEEDDLSSFSPQEIYQLAESQVNQSEFLEAAETFEEVERLHPYSEWARRGTILAAFYYGKSEEYEKSRSAGERFLASYPGDPNADYAQFLVAMSYYEQLDDRGRDQRNTELALIELQKVTANYPSSEYARSAELRFDVAVNQVASKEMEIGRYYLKRGNFTAAINRFQFVIENYNTTEQAPEALHRLVESYLSLGLIEEAREAAIVLGYNFQGSNWYAATFDLFSSQNLEIPSPDEQNEGLIREIYRRMIRGDWL